MELDMDMDLSEICDDKVQSFLAGKLEAIRLQNEALETVLTERQQGLKESTLTFPQSIRTHNFWKKIFNYKYAIGFELLLGPKKFENVRVVLNNDFEESLQYKVETFKVGSSESQCSCGEKCQYIICSLIKKSDIFESKAYVTVSFDLPKFLHRLDYNIFGNIICTLDGQDVILPLPNLEISVKDTIFKTNWLIEKNSLQNLFTVISCSNMIDLVLCLPEEWTIPLVSTFGIHCSLTDISLTDNLCFVANKISETFDNTVLIIHPHELKEGAENDIFLKICTASDEKLFAFIHHLLSCIPNSVILPNMYYQSFLNCKKSLYKERRKKALLEDFEKALQCDIDHSYYYVKNIRWRTYLAEHKTFAFNQHRAKLSEQEADTDLKYLEVLKM